MVSRSAASGAGAGGALGEAAAAWAVSRWVRVGEWQLRYRDAGRGPPLVLVHGLGMDADYWHRNAVPLAAAGNRVLAPELPGFGWSSGASTALGVEALTECLAAWARALGLGPAVYVGHSLSCQVALELAARAPELVRGLVLAGPTGDPGRHRRVRQAWGLVRDVPREPVRLLVLAARAYLRAGPARVWRTWTAGGHHQPLAVLPRVRAPGVVVVGSHDPVVPPDFARTLADGLPRGRLVWIPGGAHAVIFEPAPAFNRVVLEFLSSLESVA